MGGIHREGRILNQPLREAVLAVVTDDFTYSEICHRMDWVRKNTHRKGMAAETTGLKRCLGITTTWSTDRHDRRYATCVSTIDIDRATAIAAAIGVDLDELYGDAIEVPAGLCGECAAPLRKLDPEGLCGFCKLELELFGKVAVAA